SLLEVNMNFLYRNHELNIRDCSWGIFSKILNTAPQQMVKDAKVNDSMITDGCYVAGEVDHSILSHNVKVGRGSVVKDSVIMPNTVVGENCVIEKAIIGENACLYDGARLVVVKVSNAVICNEDRVGGFKDED